MSYNIADIKNRLSGFYQRVIKNIISLGNDSTLESDLKPLKVGEKNTPIELSESEVNVRGTINAEAINVKGSAVQTGTDAGATQLSELSDVTYSSGDLTITDLDTIVSSGDLIVDSGGKISLDSTNDSNSAIDGTTFKTAGTEFAAITSHHALSTLTLYEAGGSSTDDYFEIQVDAAGATKLNTVDAGGATAHLTLNPDGDVKFDSDGILIKDNGDVSTPASGYGSIYVNSDVLYIKTDGGTATNLLAGGGTTRWTRNTGGYITNKTSTTLYYFQYRPNSEFWSNSDSSPTSINQYDAPACQFHAPADGTLTNITASGYVNDTGAVDPFKFYVYKGTPTNDASSTSLTLIGTSAAPATISSAGKTFVINTDISSSNSFSAGDALFNMWKKDSNTGSQDVYFSITISGEYD